MTMIKDDYIFSSYLLFIRAITTLSYALGYKHNAINVFRILYILCHIPHECSSDLHELQMAACPKVDGGACEIQ